MKNQNMLSAMILVTLLLLASCSNAGNSGSDGSVEPDYDLQTYSGAGISFKMASVTGQTFPITTGDAGAAAVGDYCIAETEVTYELWSTVRDWAENRTSFPYTFANDGRQGADNGSGPVGTDKHPVTGISWRDALVWCNALTEWYNYCNSDTPLLPVYTVDGGEDITPIRDATDGAMCDTVNPQYHHSGFRLPTSDEWELAARWRTDSVNSVDGYSNPWFTKGDSASGATASCSNVTATEAVAWYGNWDGSTHAVKGKNENSLGLHDMSGNVWEWCFNAHPDAAGFPNHRLMRGGSWGALTESVQVGHVGSAIVTAAYGGIGFRLARHD